MIGDVLGAYLDTLTEREFDAAFLALLRALGYYDLHFLHGTFEFGKDFIAKLDEADGTYQYAFQTKAGDIALNDWRAARGQIDEMRTNNLAHPNFDTGAPRRTVFVTTGRLVGAAAVAAQEYRRHLEQLGEGDFETWDRETIIEYLGDRAELGLAGTFTAPFLRLVGEIAAGDTTSTRLEEFSRSWIGDDSNPRQAAVAAAIIANRCRVADRLDLAALTALLLVRTAGWHLHDTQEGDDLDDLLGQAGELFSQYAESLAERCRGHEADADLFLGDGHELAIWATYPIRCIRTAEILALHALRLRRTKPEAADEIEGIVVALVAKQPGVAHPISDAWAGSLIPVALVVGRRDAETLGAWITEITRWLANYYDGGDGLAALGASAKEELDYLAGSPLEHVSLEKRSTSLIATAVLDVVSVLERGDLYELSLNEFLAVELFPDVIEVPDNGDQYVRDGATITRQVNQAYDEGWDAVDWRRASHHRRCPDAYQLVSRGRAWEHLALTAVLRDRWFVSTMRSLLG